MEESLGLSPTLTSHWYGDNMKRRSPVSDALKRHGIGAKPDDREVNILSGKRFEEDMEDDTRGKAMRWARLVLEGPWLKESGWEIGEIIYDVGVIGYEAGYAEGYEVAKRQKEEE